MVSTEKKKSLEIVAQNTLIGEHGVPRMGRLPNMGDNRVFRIGEHDGLERSTRDL